MFSFAFRTARSGPRANGRCVDTKPRAVWSYVDVPAIAVAVGSDEPPRQHLLCKEEGRIAGGQEVRRLQRFKAAALIGAYDDAHP